MNYENNSLPGSFYDGQLQAEQRGQQMAADTLNLQLTADELKILKECQRNAIFGRGLPSGAAAMGGFYYLMKTGVIRKNSFSLAISGITGFLMGTMSYRHVCMEKLLALPNSTLKERILIAQGKQPQVRVDLQSQDNQSWFDSVLPSAEPSPMTSSLDIEPYQSNRFDEFSPTGIDTETAYAIDPLPPIVGPPQMTYDELRQRNRENYERHQRNYSRGPLSGDNTSRRPSVDSSLSSPPDEPYDVPSQPLRRSDDFLR